MNTKHSEVRAQQRGIPPLIDQCLDLYGHEEYDGHGSIVIYLDRNSIRHMERDMGRQPVALLSRWFDAYKVKSSSDGQTITIGHRTHRVFRK